VIKISFPVVIIDEVLKFITRKYIDVPASLKNDDSDKKHKKHK